MFTTLDACASFCSAVKETLGPTFGELVLSGLVALIVWWRARKRIEQSEARADAKIAVANERADSLAKTVARIEGSLRPAALLTPAPSSSSSGTFAPVVMPELPIGAPGRPSIPNPDLAGPDDLTLSGETALPAPPRSPTVPATPTSKRGES